MVCHLPSIPIFISYIYAIYMPYIDGYMMGIIVDPWRIHVCMPLIWCHIYHQQKPPMLAYIPYDWIRHGWWLIFMIDWWLILHDWCLMIEDLYRNLFGDVWSLDWFLGFSIDGGYPEWIRFWTNYHGERTMAICRTMIDNDSVHHFLRVVNVPKAMNDHESWW